VTIIRRRHVGVIFQFYNLMPTLTTAENVALPMLLDGKRPIDFAGKIDSLLELVELYDRREHKPDQLSGGEQQRIAIARALVNDPDIILADEPTGNLDSRASREILLLLRRACDLKNQTTIMVTHDPSAAAYADRVIFLRDGQIVRQLENTQNGLSPQAIMDAITEIDQDSTR
jgi:putative ABC transport system ATP-binding protein